LDAKSQKQVMAEIQREEARSQQRADESCSVGHSPMRESMYQQMVGGSTMMNPSSMIDLDMRG